MNENLQNKIVEYYSNRINYAYSVNYGINFQC